MGNDCRECRAGRPHCHHPELLLHWLSIDCAALGCPCGEPADQSVAV